MAYRRSFGRRSRFGGRRTRFGGSRFTSRRISSRRRSISRGTSFRNRGGVLR